MECGNEIAAEVKLCNKCGTTQPVDVPIIKAGDAGNTKSAPKKLDMKYIVSGVIALVFITSIAVNAIKSHSNNVNAQSSDNNETSTARPSNSNEAATAPQATPNDSATYTNVVACLMPQSPGMAFNLASNLTGFAANNPYAFSAALSSGAYATYCQVAYGEPGEENIRNGREVARNGNAIYYVVDRGAAAVGFVKH
jgi:hypothetical protein